MLKKLFFVFCFVFIYSQTGSAQVFLNSVNIHDFEKVDTVRVPLKKIEIIGNYKTKSEIILRELLFSENETVPLIQFLAAQKRLQSLELFTQVRFDIIGERNFSTLIISVHERWYIFPIPIFYLNERSWKKISYGGSLLYYNFLGRNILLNFTAAFGYNPEYKLAYYNPWFFGKHKLFTNLKLFKGKVRSLSTQYDNLEDERIGIDWLIGKRFGHFTYFGLIFNYTEITAPDSGLTLTPSGKDILPSITASFQYDNSDLKEYPHRGWNLFFMGKRAGNNKWLHYYQYGFDFRRYQPITTKTTLALRTAGMFSSGNIPVYDRFYFGYEERIRGRFYNVVEGENLITAGIEFRFPLLKVRHIDVLPLPGFEAYSSNLKFGISAGIFYDTGAIWYQDHKLVKQDFNSGFGAGIHFHFPYINVFRLECGFNSHGDAQGIAEIEKAF
jgi:outer membrane protein assembly factor BamA